MSTRDGFEGIVSDWLDDKAGRGAPDYADEILVRTTRTRQRPAWSSLERWLPMQTTLRFSPMPKLGWVLLIALAIVAAVGIAVLAAGSRSTRVPPPFGPARNGEILYAGTDNDIHALDPATGATTALITGATGDHRPLLSPDGTKLLFLRDTDVVSKRMLMVANVDGSDVRPLSGALSLADTRGGVAWSNDGSRIAVGSTIDGKPAIQVFAVDGSTKPVVIDTKDLTPAYMAFRPGDTEMTFRGMGADGDGIYAVGTDGHAWRTILPKTSGDGGVLSPDGTRIAYQTWDGTHGTIHVINAATGVDSVPLLDPPSSVALLDGEPFWSPDGTRLLFIRYATGRDNHLAVAPVAGGPVVQIGPAMPNCGCAYSAAFSPDGSKVLAYYSADDSTWILDPTGATAGTKLSSTIADAASWQRQAP